MKIRARLGVGSLKKLYFIIEVEFFWLIDNFPSVSFLYYEASSIVFRSKRGGISS